MNNKNNKQNQHCCNLMTEFLQDERLPIEYSPQFRSYYMVLEDHDTLQGLLYCPWCGTKLPESLLDQWADILEQEYGLDSPFHTTQKRKVPKEFQTDEWWQKRNL